MKSFHQKNSKNWAAWNYRTWVLRLSHVFIFIIHIIRQTGSDVCDSKDSFRYLRDTNGKIYASRWRVFIKKTQITEQHGITGAYCVYLTFSFSLFTSFNRQEVMFVSDSKDSFRFLRDTNESIFASRWRVFIKKTQRTEQHGITEREFCVYLTFSFSLFTSFDRREVMFAIRKIAFVIFATPTKQFMLADEEFSSKKNPNNWAAWNYRCVFCLSHVFIFIIHLIQQTGSDVCDSKDSFRYLRDTNETIFASRWRVFRKPT